MRELIQLDIWLLRLEIMGCFAFCMYIAAYAERRNAKYARIPTDLLTAWAAGHVAFVLFLLFNHVGFPLNLDVLESSVFQHVLRAHDGLAIYPDPSPSYAPLAYNPLFYFLAVPFSWVLGVKLSTVRIVAILGMIGIGLVIYLVTKRRTQSVWWGFMAIGVFAAAYRVMDAYLDSAHSDSWFVCSALLGTLVLDRSRSRAGNLLGVVLLVCSFWFKQHGVFFAVGGLLYLTLKEGPVRSAPYWLLAFVLGPVFYWFAGPLLFGPQFHYFTLEVPSQWTEPTLRIILRYGGFVFVFYGTLASFALWDVARDWRMNLRAHDVWRLQLVFAMIAAALGCLDYASSDNVFIPLGVFLVLEGIRGIHAAASSRTRRARVRIETAAFVLVFVQLVYDPRTVVVSPAAEESFSDLTSTLDSLHGSVYAPSIGQFERGYVLAPAAHWASLEDMVRGPGRDTRKNPVIVRLLEPCMRPNGPAYVLSHFRLHDFPPLAFLENRYILERDFGDRFKPLHTLPKRFDHRWPRYLYRFDAERAAQQARSLNNGW